MSTPAMRKTVKAEILAIGDRYLKADQDLIKAKTIEDRDQAEEQRRAAMGDLWSCRNELAELFLLMLRCTTEHNPQALRALLGDTFGPDLADLAEDIASLREGDR